LLVSLTVGAATCHAGDASRLQAYIHCDGFAGGVRGVALDRRPQTAEPWREVGFAGKSRRISVIDGYRVTYSYARTHAFASLRADQSDPARYAEDRSIVSVNFAEMAKADRALDLAEFSHRGLPVQTLTKRQLGGRTLAMAQILSDIDAVIVTIFFLNQAPEHRHFQAMEEFIGLRDAFIRGYIECVMTRRASS
jgi:hypothetical protein